MKKFRIDEILCETETHFRAIGTCLRCGFSEVQISGTVEEIVRDYGEDWEPHILAQHQHRYSARCPKCGRTFEGV